MGNPLLETSDSRQFAAKVLLAVSLSLMLLGLKVVGGDIGVALFVLGPVIGGVCAFGAWYHHEYHR